MSEARRHELGQAIAERERAEVAAELEKKRQAEAERRLTVQQFGELWTSGRLYERHGEINKLKPKKTARQDELRLARYVYPVIGDRPVDSITEVDVEQVMAYAQRVGTERLNRGRQPGQVKKARRKGSQFQVYQALRRLFDLAIVPGRLRNDTPVSRQWHKPGRDSEKLYAYLYPDELLALLRCTDIPVGRRVFYALGVYTGLRKASIYSLQWRHLDFQHRTLAVLNTKTGVPQLVEVDASLVELLRLWYERQGQPAKTSPIVTGVEVAAGKEAAALRADLSSAEVTRDVLTSNEVNVQPLRYHDLRATFSTWAKRAGRGDGWIQDRTGHLSPAMRERYQRQARTLADLGYTPFPSLSDAIPELVEGLGNVVRMLPR